MTRIIVEQDRPIQGQAAPSIATPVHSTIPAVAASVAALCMYCSKTRLVRDLLPGYSHTWQPGENRGHESTLAGSFYDAQARPSSAVALGS
jgi:hypothetical protein